MKLKFWEVVKMLYEGVLKDGAILINDNSKYYIDNNKILDYNNDAEVTINTYSNNDDWVVA